MKKVKVDLGERSYEIVVGSGILMGLGEFINKKGIGRDALLITNKPVNRLYGEELKKALIKNKIQVKSIVLPDGEKEKNLDNWRSLLGELTKYDGLGKQVFIIALGGGVIGDLAGFVAACYRRGINCVQVPTSLLSQVDSGVGGKVGVDFKNIKNLIGAFYQPKMVLADVAVLKTLPKEELRSGLAEVIKYGVIYDEDLFTLLEKNIKSIMANDHDLLEDIVVTCYKIKAKIVGEDELDKTGKRAILNFGHTIGHALEGSSKYSYRHGEAVSIGMACAAEIAVELGLCNKDVLIRLEGLLEKTGLPVRIKKGNIKEIIKTMSHDKKFVQGKTRFILPVQIGKVIIKDNIDIKLIEKIISSRSGNLHRP
ncbi:MAG: 3-dehydroquinate synthase [bacterium]|nr:3-dehydroquinate synthase [bacterium]